MGVVLSEDLQLRPCPEEGVVRLFRSRETWPDDPVFELHPAQGLILGMLDGSRSLEQAAQIVSESCGVRYHSVLGATRSVTSRFRQLLVEVDEATAARAPQRPVLRPEDFDFESSVDLRARREAAPVGLQWVVTESCNRHCRYCFRDSGPTPFPSGGELGLTLERFEDLTAEAERIGVTGLVLTGGEPVLRPDLFDVIELFARRRIRVLLTTKASIGSDDMRRIAASGWVVLHVSLDSADPAEVDHLSDTPGTFDEIMTTIRLAHEHGVEAVLRPLMTAQSFRGFGRLVDLVSAMGVREILVDMYGESCGRHEDRFLLSRDDLTALDELVIDAGERHPEISISYRTRAAREAGPRERGCVEGLRGLTFMPDGTVTRCEHWTASNALVYGDLKTQSIMQAWSSEALRQINQAPRSAFEGTACHECAELESCAVRRGRCLVTTLEAYGTAHGPDSYCPIGAFKKDGAKRRRR